MLYIALTQSETFLIGDIAKLLGIIMNGLFEFSNKFGITNIGLAIILFTIVVKILMFPLTMKQQKFSKISNILQPELKAVQKKYKGKSDQESLTRMNEETRAIYAKYGVSQTGGCLPLLIQLPIMYALFRVINNIPAYVPSVRNIFMTIVEPITKQSNYVTVLGELGDKHLMAPDKFDFTQTNVIIDLLYKLTREDWTSLQNQFSSIGSLIAEQADQVMHINNFFGINLAESPGFAITPALIIPILAGVTQWISTKLMTTNQPEEQSGEEPNSMMASMKMMTNTMPLVSAFFCITMPSGLGVYWIASSVVQIVQQIGVNMYFNHADLDAMIQKSVDKANAKREKKGLKPEKVSKLASYNTKNLKTVLSEEQDKKKTEIEKNLQKVKEATNYYNSGLAKPGSLSAKANMVQQYNERNEKKKSK